MSRSHTKTKVALAVLALAASAGVSAAPLTGISITNGYDIYAGSPPTLTKDATPTVAEAQAVLDDGTGNASGPGGNVQLGNMGGSPATVMSGTVGGKPITLSSLEHGDWTGNGNALAYRYVTGAAQAAGVLGLLTPTDITTIVNQFVAVGGPWERVSDPNVSYVYIDGHTVNIGLAGFYNAAAYLALMFPQASALGLIPRFVQVSEVVEVTLGTGPNAVHDYLFGFFATDTGITSQGGLYSGNYNVQIPEPESLALLGIGLAGLLLARRRRV